MNFGNNLKAKRLEKGMTQDDVANAIGMSRQAVHYYENELREPTLATLQNLAEVLDCTVDQLIADSEETGAAAINAEGQEEDDGNSQTPEREEG